MSQKNVYHAARHFLPPGIDYGVQKYGSGLVNDTFLITAANAEPFILQRISDIFSRPMAIMENLRTVCEHLRRRLDRDKNIRRNISIPSVRRTVSGADFFSDSAGNFWRALGYIPNCKCFNKVQSQLQAGEAGFALGNFHRLLHDLEPSRLHDTLPGFHVTPIYLAHYDKVAERVERKMTSDMHCCRDFIEKSRATASELENAFADGLLSLRPVHGDPKISNILFDEYTGGAKAIIDLDTVKPGLVQWDIADCLRSCCNTAGEEDAPEKAYFDVELCRAILQGYLGEAGTFLTPADYDFIFPALRLIAFELGLRFYTDFLEGDVYFKTFRPRQNLERARVQFALAASIELQEKEIRQILAVLH